MPQAPGEYVPYSPSVSFPWDPDHVLSYSSRIRSARFALAALMRSISLSSGGTWRCAKNCFAELLKSRVSMSSVMTPAECPLDLSISSLGIARYFFLVLESMNHPSPRSMSPSLVVL